MEATREVHPKRGRRRVNIKRLILVFVLIYGVVMAVSIIIRQQSMMAKQAEDAVLLEQQIEQIQRTNSELERKIQFTETDAYIERIARDQLGYIKEGEIKIVGRE